MKVLNLEWDFRLPLLERVKVREGNSATKSVLGLCGLEVERCRIDRDVGESGHSRGNGERPRVIVLLMVAIQVPTGDREVVVDHDAGCRLELERCPELPVHLLLAVKRGELLIGQVDDTHRLVVAERLVEADNE